MATTLDLAIRLTGIDGASRVIGGVRNQLVGLSTSAARVGGVLSATVTAPVVGALGALGGGVLDLETNLSLLQATSNATGTQMASISDLAKQLGADVNLPATSAADATAAMLELARAGLSVNDTMGAARGVLQLAAAGNLDNAQAAQIAANALNAFKLRGTEATTVANLLAAAANASSADVGELGFAFSRGAAAFAGANVPIDQFVTSLAALANAGIRGEDAGTSLKALVAGFARDTKPAIAAQRALGISFFDAQGKLKPLPEIVGDLNRGLGKLSQQKQIQVLRDIFGSDAERAARILADLGRTGFETLNRAVNRQGAAAELAAARNRGLRGALDALRSTTETLAITVLSRALPGLTGLTRRVTDLVGLFDRLDPNVQNAALALVAVLAAAGPVALAFSGLAGALAFLLTPFGLVTAALAGLATWLALDGERAGRFMAGVADLGQTILRAFGPETRNGPALVAAAFLRLTGIDVSGLLAGVARGFTFARDAVITFIGALQGTWAGSTSADIDEVTKAIGNIGLWIRNVALPALLQFAGWVQTVGVPMLVQLAGVVTGQVGPALAALGGFITGTVVPAALALGGWLQTDGVPLLGGLLNLAVALGGVLVSLVGPAFLVLAANAGTTLTEVRGLVAAFTDLLVAVTPVTGALGVLFGAVAAVLPAQLRLLTGFVQVLAGHFGQVKAIIGGIAGAFAALARGDATAALAAITSAFNEFEAASGRVRTGLGTIGGAFGQAFQGLGPGGPLGPILAGAPGTGAGGGGGGRGFGGPGGATAEEAEARRQELVHRQQVNNLLAAQIALIERHNEVLRAAPRDLQTAFSRALEI